MKNKLQKTLTHFLLVVCILSLGLGVHGDEPIFAAATSTVALDAEVTPAFVTSLQNLVESGVATAFLIEGMHNYSRIAIPSNKNAKFFYVAVPNNVIRLSLEPLELETRINWSHPAESPILRECNVGGTSKEDCTTNRIFSLLISKENLLVCGTVFGRPTCSLRLVMQPSHSVGSFDVQLRDADGRSQKALALEGRNVYVGAYLRRGTDPALYRSSLRSDSNAVRTNIEVQQSRALKPIYQPAKFISVHVVGEYAYYFFQENFEEMTTCGARSQRIISRVARVCKSDPGFRQSWLSFAKSRLVCAQGGNWVRPDGPDDESSVFYYDLLQDTFETDSHIYGVFSAAKSGIKASAICGFPFATFNKVFGDQTVKLKRWETRDGEVPYAYFVDFRDRYNRSDCASLHMRREEIATYTNNNRYNFLKAARVIQDTNEPVASGNENWLRLIVDKVPSSQPGHHHNVAFVLTEAQSIKKILLSAGTRCVLEEIQLDSSLDGRVNDMKLTPTGRFLIITTDSRIVRVPTSSCERHVLRTTCLAARDPYCGWNKRTFACTVRPDNTRQWEQDISPQLGHVCPDRSVPVDGGWSDWQPWQRCHPPRGTPGSSCSCRFRLCDNPRPRNGGRLCGKFHELHNETQAVNCSVDGGWSPWEAWSDCPACDRTRSAVKERSRTCTQPRPLYGGAPCGDPGGDPGGKETQTAPCNSPDCKDVHVAVNGSWSQWTEWSGCSRPCGVGFSKRTRYCNEAVNGGLPCIGDSREWRKCNISPCLSARNVRHTDWMRTGERNSASGQPIWLLVEASCRAHETETGEYRVELSLTNRTQQCDSPSHCAAKDSDSLKVNGNWGQWSGWSACSESCGVGGIRERKRECDNPPASGSGSYCIGAAREIEKCAQQPCQLAAWGTWNCWTDCTGPNGREGGCGTGKQYRRRHCMEGEHIVPSDSCREGQHNDNRECSLKPCDYFTQWSAWSPCKDRLRSRTRKCRLDPTSPLMARHCRGNWDQTEECAVPPEPPPAGLVTAIPSVDSTKPAPDSELLTLAYPTAGVIIAAWLLSLILASGVTVGAICCYYRRRISAYRANIGSLEKQVGLLKSAANQQQQQQQLMQQPAQHQHPLMQQRNDLDLPGYYASHHRSGGRHMSESRDTCSVNEPQPPATPGYSGGAVNMADNLMASTAAYDKSLPGRPVQSIGRGPSGLHRSLSTSESTRQPYYQHRQRHYPDGSLLAGQRVPRFAPPDAGYHHGATPAAATYDRVQLHQQPRPQPNVYVTQRSQPHPADYRPYAEPPHGAASSEDFSLESSSLMRHYHQHHHQQQQQQYPHHFEYPGGGDQYFATMPSTRSHRQQLQQQQQSQPPPQQQHQLRKMSSGSRTDNSCHSPTASGPSRGLRRQHSSRERSQQHPPQQQQPQPSENFPQKVQQTYSDFQRYLQQDHST